MRGVRVYHGDTMVAKVEGEKLVVSIPWFFFLPRVCYKTKEFLISETEGWSEKTMGDGSSSARRMARQRIERAERRQSEEQRSNQPQKDHRKAELFTHTPVTCACDDRPLHPAAYPQTS